MSTSSSLLLHRLPAPQLSRTGILHCHLPRLRRLGIPSRSSRVSVPSHCSSGRANESGRDREKEKRKAEDDRDGFSRKRLAAFVSDGSSTFQIIHHASMENKIYGDIALIVSDKPDCKACDYAKRNNISVIEYPEKKTVDNGVSPKKLLASLRAQEIDIILLFGYLKLLPQEIIQAYPRAILTIHPTLLPAFGEEGYDGIKVHEAVIKSGARYSGQTIHFVNEKGNRGVILAQRLVPVLPYDTAEDLAARVLQVEHDLYPEVIAALCEDRISWRDDGVPLIRRSWKGSEFY